MKSLRFRMTILIVLVVLVSTGLLLLISYQRSSDSMSAQLESNYSIVADKYAQELTAWVNTNATIIDTMAAQITTDSMYEKDYEAFYRYLSDNYDQLNKNGYIYDIYFTYPNNTMVCASGFLPDGTVDYTRERDWFIQPAGTGELFFSTPYRDSDSGKTVVTISKAVFRHNTLQGVLAADIFVDVLADIIREADVPANSYAFLVDQNQGMIVHPNPAYAFDDVPRGVMDVPGAPYAEVITKVRAGSGETVYLTDYDGVTRGVVVSKMQNTGWYVGIATAKAELMRSMSPLVRGYLIAAAIAVVIGAVIAVLLAHVLEKMNLQHQAYEEKVQKLQEQVAQEAARAKTRFLSGDAPQEEPQMAVLPITEKPLMSRIGLYAPILVIFLLMACMVLYTSRVINDVAATNIREVGEDRISASAAQLDNYLEMSRSSLWVTADTVDHMVRNGATTDDILNYIVEETENQKRHFDENITGLYGYIMGVYLDGLNWVPPENYDPTRRDWYLTALEADGEVAVVPPYVDAQTHDVIISICRKLTNDGDVLSIDFRMNHIQEIVSGLQIKEKGYGFIIDHNGMIIAHQDAEMKGGYLTGNESQQALMDRILEVKDGNFEIDLDGQKNNVFVRSIMNQWYVVIVISNQELLSEVRQQLIVNVLICFVIFTLIALSYFLGHKREERYSRRIEQMREEEQKQEYEAKALKLEKEAADQANKAKSDFLAEMSHEIRTPINAVLGMNEMVLRESNRARGRVGPRDGEIRSALDSIATYGLNIERAGKNLLSIINDILDFSKIEAGKAEIVEGPYKLSAVISDVTSMVAFMAREKGLQFNVHVDETIPDGLSGDETRIRQIMTNLLNNAVKYTQHGSVSLDIRCAEGDPAKEGETLRLIIAVRDTGIGIKPEDMAKLFTKFQRVDLHANSTVEGTGLGLAITRTLLSMMNGTIQVDSEYGQGSAFTVTLPQKIVSADAVGASNVRADVHAPTSQQSADVFRAPDARVLIVDDTPMNLTVAIALMKRTEVRIDTATGGEEALALTQDNAYDLILMDQRMPKMDGVETLRRIRAQESGANRQTPVICLTADAVIGARERYIAEGFTDYITKPINSQELDQMMLRYLPKDKVIQEPKEEGAASDGATANAAEDAYSLLRRVGIIPEVGLQYCRKDKNLYGSLLREYANNAEEKVRELEKFHNAKDWKNYSILVHSLKSSSKMIGASALSDIAAKLEKAADEGRQSEIGFNHDLLLEHYADAVGAIREMEGATEEDRAAEAYDTGEDDIMEFMPE